MSAIQVALSVFLILATINVPNAIQELINWIYLKYLVAILIALVLISNI
jgi:hypothetical protein